MSFNVALLKAMRAEGLDFDAAIRVLEAGEKKADPTAAARQARYRAKKGASRRDVTRNPPNDIDILTPAVTPISSEIGPIEVTPKRSKGTRLPDNWRLPDDWAQFAKDRRRWSAKEIAEEAEVFRNYWTARSGVSACHTNWARTWQNWVIRSHRKDGDTVSQAREPQSADELRRAIRFNRDCGDEARAVELGRLLAQLEKPPDSAMAANVTSIVQRIGRA